MGWMLKLLAAQTKVLISARQINLIGYLLLKVVPRKLKLHGTALRYVESFRGFKDVVLLSGIRSVVFVAC